MGEPVRRELHAALPAASCACLTRRLEELEIAHGTAGAGCDTALTVTIDHRDAGSGIGARPRAMSAKCSTMIPPGHFVRRDTSSLAAARAGA